MALSIITEKCTSIESTSLQVNCMVDGLDLVDQPFFVYFEYKKTADIVFNTTEFKRYDKQGSYLDKIEGLKESTSYDIVAVINDGTTTVKGTTITTQTLSSLGVRTAANYDSLIAKTVGTLQSELSASRISSVQYGESLVGTIQATMNLSYTMASQEAINIAQKEMIDAQKKTEVERATLTARQTAMYDDNLRVEEGKMLTQVVGMYGAGGTALPAGLETQMINAVNAVTPTNIQ